MKHLDEYRDPKLVASLLARIKEQPQPVRTIMEICGGQTHSIVKYGFNRLIAENVNLVHGPGCPVCVTPIEKIDLAINLAQRDDVIFCSFGDMLRVPGHSSSLIEARTSGADVRIVYSPLDCLTVAQQHPEKQVVFLAIGFETTASANAVALPIPRPAPVTIATFPSNMPSLLLK